MTSFLAGPLARQIARGFKGKLLIGTIRRAGPYTLDDFGDQVISGYAVYTFTGMRENFDARYRAQALIPETDVKILVLLASTQPTVIPVQSDQILINGDWHQARRILDVDPAGATMSIQAFVIPDPTGGVPVITTPVPIPEIVFPITVDLSVVAGQVIATFTAENSPTSWNIVSGNLFGYFAISSSGVLSITSAGAAVFNFFTENTTINLKIAAANSDGTSDPQSVQVLVRIR